MPVTLMFTFPESFLKIVKGIITESYKMGFRYQTDDLYVKKGVNVINDNFLI